MNWLKDILNLTVLILAIMVSWMLMDIVAKDLAGWRIMIQTGGKP